MKGYPTDISGNYIKPRGLQSNLDLAKLKKEIKILTEFLREMLSGDFTREEQKEIFDKLNTSEEKIRKTINDLRIELKRRKGIIQPYRPPAA